MKRGEVDGDGDSERGKINLSGVRCELPMLHAWSQRSDVRGE